MREDTNVKSFEDLSLLSTEELEKLGFVRLPEALSDALILMEKSDMVRSWFGDLFLDVYLKHKRGEIEYLEGRTVEEICQLYERVY
jgi:glutamine synthetase